MSEEPVIYEPTPYQARVITLPKEVSTVFLGGGRGSGKTMACAFLALDHCAEFGFQASVLYVRNSFAGLRDAERNFVNLFRAAYPDLSHNIKDGLVRLPSGASIEFGQLTTVQQSFAAKYQGRSWSLIIVDECGAYPDGSVEDALRSCLRAPKGVSTRLVLSANPGGAGHLHLLKRYVRRLPPWTITSLPGVADCIVHCPGTYRDNTALNQEQYARMLEQSAANDPSRLASWKEGNWEAGLSDLYFAANFDEERNVIPEFHAWPPQARPLLSCDWGSSRPCVFGLLANFPRAFQVNGLFLPPKSLVQVDEVTTVLPEGLNVGSGAVPSEIAEEVKKMWSEWQLPGYPQGVADDSMFYRPGGRTSSSIADQFKQAGVHLRPAAKGRRDWTQMKAMLSAAGRSQTEPGLFFTPRAEYSLSTLPFLPRDHRRPDDILTSGPDHAADMLRYSILGAGFRQENVRRRIGTYYGDGGAAYFKKLDREIAFTSEAKRRAR